ncbi:MAG: flagellar basal body rod protein FlgB, partial [Candidatus Kapaibacteriota bacterium]
MLFKERVPLMHKALDAYSLRMTTIAENISNANTVGYSPKRVAFEELFEQNISQMQNFFNTKGNGLGKVESNKIFEPLVVEEEIPESQKYSSGQSHVNLDEEMALLAETQIRFRLVSRLIRRYFASLNSAITGIREQ